MVLLKSDFSGEWGLLPAQGYGRVSERDWCGMDDEEDGGIYGLWHRGRQDEADFDV